MFESARRLHGFRSRVPAPCLLLGLVLAVLAGCGGSGGAESPPAGNEAAIAAARNGELLAYLRKRLAERGPQSAPWLAVGDQPVWLTTAATASGAVTRTGTVVQEAGVDEDDLIKTDGDRLYTLQPLQHDGQAGSPFARLAVYGRDAAGHAQAAGEAAISSDNSSWNSVRGMLLVPETRRVAVLSESAEWAANFPDCPPNLVCASFAPWQPTQPRLQVQVFDAREPDAMPRPQRLQIDGRLVGSRLIGRTLYLVAVHAPVTAFDRLPLDATTAERQAALDRLSLDQVLPTIRINGGSSQPLVDEGDCWLQPGNPSTEVALTTLTAIDLDTPERMPASRCFVGGTQALYMAPASIYLATSRQAVQTQDGRLVFPGTMRTDIHKFSVNGRSIAYRGSGSVDGSLGWDSQRAPYRMSEHNGDLRVLSFTGSWGWRVADDAARVAPSPATLTVLRERASDASLQVLATLPNARRPAALGKPGEQVYGVRFLGDRGYLVTFRQTDPLYVLDLSDPTDPRAVGELQVPGFSDWLFPLDGGLLFGVGKDADATGRVQGVQVALFDLRDAANPRLLDRRRYGGPGSSSALDTSAHGLAMQTVGTVTRLALPMLLMPTEPGLMQQQLQRFEVDSAARSLVAKPPIEQGSGWTDFGSARSLLLGNQVHHLRDGKLQSWDW